VGSSLEECPGVFARRQCRCQRCGQPVLPFHWVPEAPRWDDTTVPGSPVRHTVASSTGFATRLPSPSAVHAGGHSALPRSPLLMPQKPLCVSDLGILGPACLLRWYGAPRSEGWRYRGGIAKNGASSAQSFCWPLALATAWNLAEGSLTAACSSLSPRVLSRAPVRVPAPAVGTNAGGNADEDTAVCVCQCGSQGSVTAGIFGSSMADWAVFFVWPWAASMRFPRTTFGPTPRRGHCGVYRLQAYPAGPCQTAS